MQPLLENFATLVSREIHDPAMVNLLLKGIAEDMFSVPSDSASLENQGYLSEFLSRWTLRLSHFEVQSKITGYRMHDSLALLQAVWDDHRDDARVWMPESPDGLRDDQGRDWECIMVTDIAVERLWVAFAFTWDNPI